MRKLTKRKPDESMNVWIELPLYESDDECREAVEKLNRMMERMDCGIKQPRQKFRFSSETDRRPKHYQLVDGPSGSFRELGDNGEWFNLDYLGRENDDPETFKFRKGEK